MELNLEELDGLKRRIHFQFASDEVQAIYRKIFRKYQKEVKIPGFRVGKVPLQILEKKHGSQMQAETKQKIEEEVFQAAKTKFSIQYAHQPKFAEHLQEFDVRKDQNLQSFAEVEVLPTITLLSPKQIKVKPEQPVVKEEEIQQQLVDLELHFSQFVQTEQTIQNKDRVSLIIEGVIEGGEKFNEKREKTQVFIGQKMLLEALENALIGHKAAETVKITHQFSPDFEQQQLAGKKVDFVLSIEQVERPDPFVWNEESFAKIDPSIKDMEALMTWLKQKIIELKSRDILQKKIQETNNFLLDFLDFPLPEKLVQSMKIEFYRQDKEYQDLLLAVQEGEKNAAKKITIKESNSSDEKQVTLAEARKLMNQKETEYLQKAKKELRLNLYVQKIVDDHQFKPDQLAINQSFVQFAQSASVDAQEFIKMPYGKQFYEQLIQQNLKDQALQWQWQQVVAPTQ